jgi:hypothetical protein
VAALALAALILAGLPVALAAINFAFYRRLPEPTEPPPISVLIPARNEEKNIGAAIASVLTSRGIALEIMVLDDHSVDFTAAIVRDYATRDLRVRLEAAQHLPAGWSGKQHACWTLSQRARHEILLFMDADVRLTPDALGRIAATLSARPIGLLSGFPRQIMCTPGEKLIVPMILFLLLGYLPMPGLRWTRFTIFGAGCGQLMAVKRKDYARAGGHAAIRASLHDGLKLPRAFRANGIRTDLFDASDIASCRMYEGFRDVWSGFSKNATEGMATPVALSVWTVLLAGGHVLPFALLLWALFDGIPENALRMALAAAALSLGLRLFLAGRFHQSLLGAVLHPAGVLITLTIQAASLWRSLKGQAPMWRGRSYPAA